MSPAIEQHRMRTTVLTLIGVLAFGLIATASPKNPDKEETVIVYRNTQSFFDIAGWPDDHIGALADVHIHEYPSRGEIKINLMDEGFIFYPDLDLCAANDEFIYTVKYGDWMETYRIKLEIVCDAPTIIAQFSPKATNGEYTSFTILGVQSFPGNTLAIFDKAGRPIFKEADYKNTWEGRLPDGTYARTEDEYLYVFDDGNGNLYSGYIRVQ